MLRRGSVFKILEEEHYLLTQFVPELNVDQPWLQGSIDCVIFSPSLPEVCVPKVPGANMPSSKHQLKLDKIPSNPPLGAVKNKFQVWLWNIDLIPLMSYNCQWCAALLSVMLTLILDHETMTICHRILGLGRRTDYTRLIQQNCQSLAVWPHNVWY